jgi:hypothetical protein
MSELMMVGHQLITGLLADNGPHQTGPDFGKASPFGLVVVVVLMIGTFFLIVSMNRHLKKLPKSFDADHPEPERGIDTGSATSDGTPDEPGR